MARVRVFVVAVMLLLALQTGTAQDAAKSLVIVRGGGGPGETGVTNTFREEMERRWPGRLYFHTEDVDPDRFTAGGYDRELPEYLRAKHRGRTHLVLALSDPALEFVLANRERVFADAPILYAGNTRTIAELKQRRIPGVVVVPDVAGTIDVALALHPQTKRVVVVSGMSPSDRVAEQAAMRQLARHAAKIHVRSLTGLPVAGVLDEIRNLPPDTLVFYTRLTRDAADAKYDPREALELVRRATALPIYGCARSYLGAGIVGGVLVDEAAAGRTLAGVASAILAGERPELIPPTEASSALAFDKRELVRLGIGHLVPQGAAIEFQSPSSWDRWRLPTTYIPLMTVTLSLLVVGFVLQRRKHRDLLRSLEQRRLFEKNFSEISTAFITTPRSSIDLAVRGALQRVVETFSADVVAIYEAPAASDGLWTPRFFETAHRKGIAPPFEDWDPQRSPSIASKLRAGQIVACFSGEDREQLAAAATWRLKPPAAAVIVPLAVGPSVLGALWCIWFRTAGAKFDREAMIERFRLVGELLANALQRGGMQDQIDETAALNVAILSSLSLNVAVLDRDGVIIALNEAWLRFGRRNGASSDATIGIGVNYLDVTARAAREGVATAREALAGLRDVCEGRRQLFTLEYECSSPFEQRWYQMTVAALRRKGGGAVVTHRDISETKQNEAAIRESEARFRLLADALPVSVWMSDVDGRRTYFNRAWLDFTGRALPSLMGDGWIDTVHPDDVATYLESYRAAVATRSPFSMEYRIRRRDGGYGWFVDNAVPRYSADDDRFLGFVGGCLNVSRRKEAEEALHDVTGRVISAEEEDRRRIARDRHDGVNQLVALLAIDIDRLGSAPITSQETLSEKAQGLWKRTAEIASELHRLSHALHPARLETFGLVPALEACCAEVVQQTKIRVLFSQEDLPDSIPPDVALCVFRIVQESLRNVMRHSGATEARVELTGGPAHLSVSVIDDGSGFDTVRKSAGLGLVSMRERVRFAGGELSITSRPGQGSCIRVSLPLHVAAPAAGQPVGAADTA